MNINDFNTGYDFNLPTAGKAERLQENKQEKLSKLAEDTGWKSAILESYTDADSPTIVGVTGGKGKGQDLTGKLTEDRDSGFDAYEVAHPNDPYRNTESGITKYERQRQRLANDIKQDPSLVGKLGIKDPNNITDDDIVRAGTREQLLGLYNLIPGEKAAWEPGPLDGFNSNNPLELGSKETPLNIPIERKATGEYGYFGRPLAEVRNKDTQVTTKDALGYTGAEDANFNPLEAAKKLKAEGKLTPEVAEYLAKSADKLAFTGKSNEQIYAESRIGDLGYRAANVAKAVASGVAGAAYDVADLGAELFGKDFGTDEEKTKVVNELTGYNPIYSTTAGQRVKDKITEMTKNGVTVDSVFDVLAAGGSTPEFLGESIGWLIPMMLGGTVSTGGRAVNAATKALSKAKTAEAAVGAADKLAEAKSKYTGLQKAADFMSRNAGLFVTSAGETNDTLDKYAENAGIDKADINTEKVIGSYMTNVFKNSIDRWSDLGILKSPDMASGFASILKGATKKQLAEVGAGLAKVGKAGVIGGGKEAGTEYIQTFFEQVGEQVGEQAKKTVMDAWADQSNEIDRLTGAALGLTGAQQMNVASIGTQAAVGTANLLKPKAKVPGAKPTEDTTEVNAEDVTFAGPTVGLDEETYQETKQIFELAKKGNQVGDRSDLANASTDLERHLRLNKQIDTDEYADVVNERNKVYDEIYSKAVEASMIPENATEAEEQASVQAFNQVFDDYGLSAEAREDLLVHMSTGQKLGTLPMTEEVKAEIDSMLDAALAGGEIPVIAPQTSAETKAKIEENVAKAQAKKSGSEGVKVEDGYTVGVSERTVKSLADRFKLSTEAVRNALEIAVPMMKIKQMKHVSKEADQKQRDMYYGKDGINPMYIGYKKAVQDGDSEAAYTFVDKMKKKAASLERELFRHEDISKDVEKIADNTLKRYAEGKIDADRAGRELTNNTKKVGDKYTISGMDVVYDKMPQELKDKFPRPENKAYEVIQAKKEARDHIDQLLAHEGIRRPETKFKEVKVADRVAEYESRVADLEKQVAEQEKVVDETEDPVTRTNETKELEYLKGKLAEEQAILKKYKTNYPDKDVIYRDIYETAEEDVQETKETVKAKAGQEVGTQTTEQAEKAKAEGREVKAETVKEIKQVVDKAEVAETLDKINKLKEDVDTLAAETSNKIEKVKEKLQADKKLESDLSEANGKVYSKLKGTLEGLYNQLDKLKAEKKAKSKELRQAVKAEEKLQEDIVDTSVTVDSVYKDVRDVEKRAEATPREYRQGKVTLKELGTLAKEVYGKLSKLNKVVGLTVMKVRRVLANRKASEVKQELESIDKQIAQTQESIKAAVAEAKAGVDTQKQMKLVEQVAKGIQRKKKLKEILYGDKSVGKAKSERVKKIWEEIRALEKTLFGTRLVSDAVHSSWLKDSAESKKGVELNLSEQLKVKSTLFGQIEAKELAALIKDEKVRKEYLETVNTARDVLGQVLVAPKQQAFSVEDDPASYILWDKVGDKLEMNEQVAAVIALVANEYIGSHGTTLVKNTKADVARMLGKLEDWQVTPQEYAMLREGRLLVNEATSVGAQVMRQLGISKDNSKMPIGQYAQLTSAMGMYVLLYAQAKGDIQPLVDTKISSAEWNKVMEQKQVGEGLSVGLVKGKAENKKRYGELKDTAKKISEALDIQDVSKDYRTSPIKTEGKTYEVRNGYGDAPAKNQEVLRVLEDQEWVVVEDAVKDLLAIDDKVLHELMGWTDPKTMEGVYLKAEVEAQEAVNREIENSVSTLKEVSKRVLDKKISNRMYFEWFFSKNGRYFIDSVGLNPQTDKQLSRFLVVPKGANEVTWDLNDKKDELYFASGILQGLGVELDGETTQDILDAWEILKTKVKGKDYLSELKTDLLAGKEHKLGNLTLEVAHVGHTLQALAALDKYKNSKGNKVKAVVTMEFDAKTSGFAFKLLQLPFESAEDQAYWLEKTAIYIEGEKLGKIKGKGSNDALKTIEDAYRTLGRNAQEGVEELTFEEEGDVFRMWEAITKAEGAIEPMLDKNDKVTKFARELFKYPFMRFNYAESIKSNKSSLAYDLTTKLLAKIVKGEITDENSPELFEKLGMKSDKLRKALAEKEPEYIMVQVTKLNKEGKAVKVTTSVEEVFKKTFEATYGKVLEDVMTQEFGHLVEANELMIAATQVMADGFIAELKVLQEENPNMTQAELKEAIKKLEKVFPIIKAPFSESRSDGISLIGDRRSSTDKWPAQVKVTDEAGTDKSGKVQKSLTVQAIIREFERAQAAGAVIPTHWTDGSVISEVLMNGDVLGIHDAIALGLGGAKTEAMVKEMNKATLTISRDYNILQVLLDAYVESLSSMTDKGLEALQEAKGRTAAQILEELTELTNKNNKLRSEMFQKSMAVGNIVAYEGTIYNSQGIKEIDGILSDKELKVLKGRNVDLNAINDMVKKAVKECMNG